MGAYAIPTEKSFITKKKIKKTINNPRLREGLNLVKNAKIIIDEEKNVIRIEKNDK